MEVTSWKKTKSRKAGYMIRVSKSEALSLIISLAKQMESGNANVDRVELFTKHGEYFSIGVVEELVKRCSCGFTTTDQIKFCAHLRNKKRNHEDVSLQAQKKSDCAKFWVGKIYGVI